MHHHDALIADPEGQKERFLSQWEQIATFFQSYPDSLLFEVLNEPNGKFTGDHWNEYFPAALARIRATNPTRTVLQGVAEWGGLGGLGKLQVPDDPNLILTIHYYNPFQFTHQGADWSGEESKNWLGTKWLDSQLEREVIHNEFKAAKAFGTEHNIPIHIGEFGAYSKADIESRARWTTYLSRWFEDQGFSWAYWEFSAGFGIYNPTTKQFIQPLVNALLHNPIPEPARVEVTPIYKSNFTIGNDGWSAGVNSGAAATMTRSNGKLIINISNGGTEGWHVQLVKSNIKLEAGKTYRVSYKASSPTPRSISTYVGKASDPWNAYSGYTSITTSTTEETYSYIFKSEISDNYARMVFDLGNSTTGFTITDISIESIVIIPTGIEAISKNEFSYYPNPVANELFVKNSGDFKRAEIINLAGTKIAEIELTQGVNRIETAKLISGVYFLRLSGGMVQESVKFIRQ